MPGDGMMFWEYIALPLSTALTIWAGVSFGSRDEGLVAYIKCAVGCLIAGGATLGILAVATDGVRYVLAFLLAAMIAGGQRWFQVLRTQQRRFPEQHADS